MPVNNTNFYSHKIDMYIGNSTILCFSAYITKDDPRSYIIKKVPKLGIDPISKNLFDDIVNGELKSTFINEGLEKIEITIDEGNAFSNIEKYINLQEQGYYANKMSLIALPYVDSIGFRFNGSPYNLKYSIPRKAANKFEEIANDAIKIIEQEAENDEFYASEPVAASTMIKFSNEKLDPNLEDVIGKLSNDLINNSIDTEYINDNQYGELYKKLLKSFKTIPSILELDSFEIVINDNYYPMSNFEYIREAQTHIYNEPFETRGMKCGSEYISNNRILSVKLSTEDGVIHIHISADEDRMIKDVESIPLNSETQRVFVKGFSLGEETYFCRELTLITINP